jgi:hypothetical protein
MAKQCELLATHTRAEMSLCNHYSVHQNLNSSFVFAPIHPHFKGQTMKNEFLDYLTAIALGLMLCIGLLEWFDVLVK